MPSLVGVETDRCGISWVENATALATPSISSTDRPLESISISVVSSVMASGSAGMRLWVSK